MVFVVKEANDFTRRTVNDDLKREKRCDQIIQMVNSSINLGGTDSFVF